MGMICGIVGVTSDQIRALRVAPNLTSDSITVAQDELRQRKRDETMLRLPPEKRADAEERYRTMESSPLMQGLHKEVTQARERLSAIAPFSAGLTLEKSWHILHFLFTGDIGPTNPPADMLLTGDELGTDMGYGPPRIHGEAATLDFSTFLGGLDLNTLRSHINYAKMRDAHVYGLPGGRDPETVYEDDLRAEVSAYFPLLRDYVKNASEQGNGLLLWLT